MKNILSILVVIILTILCMGCTDIKLEEKGIDNTADTSTPDWMVSVSSYYLEVSSNPVTTSYVPAEDGLGKVFTYKVQDSYASREEVENEKNRLSAALSDFKNRYMQQLSAEDSQQALDDFNEIFNMLNQYEDEHFPLTAEEQAQKEEDDKKASLYGSLDLAKDDYVEYQYTGSPPYAETVYKNMLQIVSEYESGNITIEEALEKRDKVNKGKGTGDFSID